MEATTLAAKEVKERVDAGRARLLDVRTPAEHEAVHIEGSRLMPLDGLDVARVRLEAGDCECVVVCQSGKRAEMARRQLAAAGCDKVVVLEGGVAAWEAAGLPVVRGRQVLSLERQTRIVMGVLVLAGVILGAWVHPGFLALAAFIGAGLVMAGITDWCGLALLLAKAPWNQRGGAGTQGGSCSV